jgi:hypothetical protein
MDRNEAGTVVCATREHPSGPNGSSPACRQLVATLVYDSRVHAVATDVRSIKTGFPRLLYKAPGVEIDLQVRLSATAGRFCLFGQILDDGFDPYEGWVLVEAARGIVQTGLDEHGNFSIDNLPTGDYQMEVSLPEAHIDIPPIRF